MKKKNRFLTIILTLILMLSLMTTFAYASESTEEYHDMGENAAQGIDNSIDGADTETEEENFFAVLYNGISAYASEILSALALVASLILAYCYRRGLTPLIKNALTNFGTALSGMRDAAKSGEENSKLISEALTERVASAEEVISKLTENITKVSEALDRQAEESGEMANMRVILTAQIDMLYNIFMTSALPQYQKDAVGEKISAMREVLSGGIGG